MDEPNPYEAPTAPLAATTTGPLRKIDRVIAARMIQAHDQGGYSAWLFVRWSFKGHLFLFVYLVLAVAALVAFAGGEGVATAIGVYFGLLLRDFMWCHASGIAWPFTERV